MLPVCARLQVSYMILERVTPVTHSIGNCLKRVIVIVASVIVFGNYMSPQSKIGRSADTGQCAIIIYSYFGASAVWMGWIGT